jgi:hypothetical protein
MCLFMSIIFIFILCNNNSSCLTIIIMKNYRKSYGNIIRRKEKKKLIVIKNAKQGGAKVGFKITLQFRLRIIVSFSKGKLIILESIRECTNCKQYFCTICLIFPFLPNCPIKMCLAMTRYILMLPDTKFCVLLCTPKACITGPNFWPNLSTIIGHPSFGLN